MSVPWHYFMSDYNQETNFSEKTLSTRNGNPIIGVVSLRILKIILQKKGHDISALASLHCDAITSYRNKADGTTEKIFTPLDIIEIDTSGTGRSVLSVGHDLKVNICDVRKLQFWVQDLVSGKKLAISLQLFCAYSHQC